MPLAPTLADFIPTSEWTIDDAIETYNIDRWGLGYFGINDKGHVTISPAREAGATIDVMDVLKDAEEWNLRFPLVIRFQDLLRDRVMNLNKGFNDAIKETNYQGQYFGVFRSRSISFERSSKRSKTQAVHSIMDLKPVRNRNYSLRLLRITRTIR